MNHHLRDRIARVLLVGTFVIGSGLLVRAIAPQDVGTWRLLDSVPDGRVGAASVVLGDGRILIAGGVSDAVPTDAVVVVNPADGSHATIGHMVAAREGHTATLLSDGRVLIAGGRVDGLLTADLEIFDPVSGSSALVASLAEPRAGHAAAPLPDGRVLVAGGTGVNGVVDTVEIYDAENAAAFPMAVHMVSPRTAASATPLLDGRVLIAGGNDGSQDLASAEVFDPWALEFAATSTALSVARSGHSALLLPGNNSVLIAGGTSNGVAQQAVDLFLPAQFPDPYSYGMGAFAAAAPLNQARARAVAAPDREGYAFVTGGGANDAESFRFATIKTDRDDYAPGHAAVITGTGWQPDTDVTLLFQEDPAVHTDYELHVKTDATGNLYWDQWAPEAHDLNVRFYLLATQVTAAGERRAQITFTDSTNVSTDTSLDALASPVTSGQANVAFSGDVSVRAGDPPVPAGSLVQLTFGTGCTGSMTQVVTAVTNAAGHYSGTFSAPSAGGQYKYRAEFQGATQGPNGSGTNWQKSSSACRDLVVNGQAATALTVSPAASTYGSTVNLAATLTSGGSGVNGKSVAFTLNGAPVGSAVTNASGVASLTGVSLATIDAGFYPTGVSASFTADASFLASNASAPLTVGRANQPALTVSVPTPGVFNHVYTLTTSGGGGTGLVTYDVGTSDACTVNGDQLTMTMGSGGACTVTATKASDTNYNQAASLPTSVTLAKASQASVSISAPASATYGDTGLSAVASGGSGSGAFSYSAGSSTACSIDVTSGAITILSGVGTCSLTASRAGDANYTDSAASAPATITIQKATLTVTPDGGKSKTYGQTFTAFSGSVDGLVNGDTGTPSYDSPGAAASASVGKYDITSSFVFSSGSADNYVIHANTATDGLTVHKAPVTATAGHGLAVYDGGVHSPSSCVVSGAFTGDLSCSNDPATVGPDAGTTAIAPIVTGTGLENFDVTPVSGNFTIEQAESVTTVTCPASVTYNGSAQTPCSASVTGAGGLNQSLTVNYSDNTNAGTGAASASFAGDMNHTASGDDATFTINKAASQTTLTCPASVTYTGLALTPCSATVTGAGGLQQPVAVNYGDNTNAGTAHATATFAGDANHDGSSDEKWFVINFNVCALYDQTKAVKQNATVPVKFFLCDASGRDVSSASIVVSAVSLAPKAGSLSGVVEDAGNANPDNNFRFDPTLGPSGGYIFNLSTKGLGAAIWNLSFTVNGQTSSSYQLAFGVK